MSFFRLLLGVALLISGAACRKQAVASPEALAREAVGRILVTKIPAGATKVEYSGAAMMTRVEDVRFECSEADFKAFWTGSPKLSEAMPFESLAGIPSSLAKLLDTKWTAGGGTLFCQIEAGRVGSGQVAVTIKTTFESDR